MRLFHSAIFVFLTMGCFAQGSMNVSMIYHWADSTLPASAAHSNTYNEIWGYEQDGREYAIIGTTNGVHIHDITDEGSEQQVAFIPGSEQGVVVVHRDYHDYGGYLYTVCDEGNSTLQIIDMTSLPDSAPEVYSSNALFPRAHNIFIDSVSARMYVCGGPLQFAVYSLADPVNPTLLVNAPTQVGFWGNIGYVHDVYVENDIAYCNAGDNGFFVVDFSDVNDILLLGALTFYPQPGYNHSGWLMDNGDYYCLADENHGLDMKILDVSDLSDIEVLDTIDTGVNPLSIPHNPIYDGDLLHVAYYHDGYYVWDCSDPASPVIAGYYDTSTQPHQTDYRGAWGVYPFLTSGKVLVSDMQEGLFVLDISNVTDVENREELHAELTVFPTVADQRIFLNVPVLENDAELSVVNGLGQTVLSKGIAARANVTTDQLNVGQLPSGLYHVVLRSEHGMVSSKFVKR